MRVCCLIFRFGVVCVLLASCPTNRSSDLPGSRQKHHGPAIVNNYDNCSARRMIALIPDALTLVKNNILFSNHSVPS